MITWEELKSDSKKMENYLREEIEVNGKSYRGIAKELNIDHSCVINKSKIFGIKSSFRNNGLTQDEAFKLINSIGGELVGKFVRFKDKAQFKCIECGDIYECTFNCVVNKKKILCNKCGFGKLTQREVEKTISKKGTELLSKYNGSHNKITIKCIRCSQPFEKYYSDVVSHDCLLCHDCGGSSVNLNKYVNHTFFDTWSHDMAYILGIMITDGCVCGDLIEFGQIDKDLIEYIHKLLCPRHSIVIKKAGKTEFFNGHISNCKEFYRLSFTSNHIKNTLFNFGIMERKSLIMKKIPDCPDEYKPSLLRGIFDGDGTIGMYKRKNRPNSYEISWGIYSGSLEMLKDICKNFDMLDKMKIVKRNNGVCALYISSHKYIYYICNYMYSTPGFYLSRKKKIFDKASGYIKLNNKV